MHTAKGDIPVRHILAVQGDRVEPVSYWTTVGDKVVLNGIETKIAQIGYGVEGYVSDGMIFRISSIDGSPEHGFVIQQQFTSSLMDALNPSVRSRIAGL